jgi:hypothetical protein
MSQSKEAHQPFQVLSGCRQLKLFRYVPQSPQPHTTQLYPLLEFGKQSFDFVASTP